MTCPDCGKLRHEGPCEAAEEPDALELLRELISRQVAQAAEAPGHGQDAIKLLLVLFLWRLRH